jgi:phage-related protein
MKTLVIRKGGRHTIRAIATEAGDGGRDPCPTLKFFQEQAMGWPAEMAKLGAVLSETAENGPPNDKTKFKNLHGTRGLYEFKSPQGLRLICFWDDGGLIICTHGYVKDKQKAPRSEIKRAQRMMRDYFDAKTNGTLTHAEPKTKTL